MKRILTVFTIGVMIMFSGCRSNDLTYYKDNTPPLDIKSYFNGHIEAWGIVQDWRGRVINRFDVNMVGNWKGNKGVLKEEFVYYDGKTQHRTWHIIKKDDGTYEGTADDIIGKATGLGQGNVVTWQYTMDLPVGEKHYRIAFDDWMWHMNDGVLINRSYMKKFGLTVAELTLFMKKAE